MANLKRLKGSEKIRKIAGVMLGSDDIRGTKQTLFEVASNSIDRFKKGYGDKIIITKHKDLSYTISDFADGLPMEWDEDEQAYNFDLALNTLYAGENYEDENRINGTLGKHGLGLTSTQYSSEFMDVIVYRDGFKYKASFKEGRPINKDTNEFVCEDDDAMLSKEVGGLVLSKEKADRGTTGTLIHYRPDLNVFTDIDIPSEWFIDKFKKQAMVNQGLTIVYIDEIENSTNTFIYESIPQYIEELSEGKNISDIIYFEGKGEGRDIKTKPLYDVSYKIAFAFNNEVNIFQHYHNSSELTDRDSVTSVSVEKALTNALHEYIKNNNMYLKNESKIKFVDLEDSLMVVISSKSSYTSYANQTKLSIDNRFIKEFLTEKIKEQFDIYLLENKLAASSIINQILINKRANDKATLSKQELKKKLQGDKKKSNKIEGVKHCDFKNSKVEERIFIVDEGISANETIIDSIDSRIMGCCGLRGRFINSLKASVSDVLNNEPALRIIQALGCGIEIPPEERKKYKDIQTFNMDNLNYGSFAILCDADAFGKGINLGIITFVFKFMKTLLKQRRVYLVKSPRFEFMLKNGESLFVYDEKEKEELISKLNSENRSYTIGIKKGLGEFNKEDFWEYVLSDEARKKTFIPIEYEKVEELIINEYFMTFMGDDTRDRKEFIRKNIVNVDLDTIE